jgi:hypothetical protein
VFGEVVAADLLPVAGVEVGLHVLLVGLGEGVRNLGLVEVLLRLVGVLLGRLVVDGLLRRRRSRTNRPPRVSWLVRERYLLQRLRTGSKT